MKILVAVASKHGSTQEIAYFIAKVIRERGIEADVKNIEDVAGISGYQAVVLGSAVYAGSWLKSAMDFVDERAGELSKLPVWLFSSGPIGKIPAASNAVKIEGQMAKTKALEHRLFGGKVDKSQLSFAQKAMLYAVGAQNGDFRDWAEIENWAADIARSLSSQRAKVKEPAYHG